MKRNTLEVVVGAQFGSEAKGHVTQRLTERALRRHSAVQVIRVAGPNAGHTGYDSTGRAWALRQVPVAAVVDGAVVLGIGPGSEIDLPVLLDEIDSLTQAGLMKDKVMWVSGEATMITDRHKEIEAGAMVASTDGTYATATNLVQTIGSTGKGIGAARAERLMRRASRLMDNKQAMDALNRRGVVVTANYGDGPSFALNAPHTIVEGTQGYGLGLRAGHYPQCTSSDCRAVDFVAMAGLSPWEFGMVDVWAVARIFPIRVAGNSGPLEDETTWEALGLPEERTTVTKKVRRVGMPDWDLVRRAVRANGGAPTVKIAVTMLDQKFPDLRDERLTGTEDDEVWAYLKEIEGAVQTQIGMITTGPNTAQFL